MLHARADVERVIGRIWKELMKTPTVAPSDNFLDLGGNSLRAGELVAGIQAELGVEITIDVVLREETFSSLVQAVVEAMQEQDSVAPADANGSR